MILEFVISLILFVIIDFVWIGLIMNKYYKAEISKVSKFRDNVNYFSALGVYILLSLGIIIFVSLMQDSLINSVIYGGLLGLITYGVYDLTNYAVFEKWSLKMSIIDILWGTILCSIVSVIVFYL